MHWDAVTSKELKSCSTGKQLELYRKLKSCAAADSKYSDLALSVNCSQLNSFGVTTKTNLVLLILKPTHIKLETALENGYWPLLVIESVCKSLPRLVSEQSMLTEIPQNIDIFTCAPEIKDPFIFPSLQLPENPLKHLLPYGSCNSSKSILICSLLVVYLNIFESELKDQLYPVREVRLEKRTSQILSSTKSRQLAWLKLRKHLSQTRVVLR